MKKCIGAGLILLLIFGGCLINIRYIDGLTEELLTLADDAVALSEAGKTEEAVRQAEKAAGLWAQKDGYTHIFIRHSEIDSATDAFFDFLGAICEGDPGEIRGAHQKLRAHLTSIAGMEHISFGSVM